MFNPYRLVVFYRYNGKDVKPHLEFTEGHLPDPDRRRIQARLEEEYQSLTAQGDSALYFGDALHGVPFPALFLVQTQKEGSDRNPTLRLQYLPCAPLPGRAPAPGTGWPAALVDCLQQGLTGRILACAEPAEQQKISRTFEEFCALTMGEPECLALLLLASYAAYARRMGKLQLQECVGKYQATQAALEPALQAWFSTKPPGAGPGSAANSRWTGIFRPLGRLLPF